jgi:hypothetical protein
MDSSHKLRQHRCDQYLEPYYPKWSLFDNMKEIVLQNIPNPSTQGHTEVERRFSFSMKPAVAFYPWWSSNYFQIKIYINIMHAKVRGIFFLTDVLPTIDILCRFLYLSEAFSPIFLLSFCRELKVHNISKIELGVLRTPKIAEDILLKSIFINS